MNLEDYAYEEDGRWYVNPQVALDERNAFIDNYRGSVAEDNAKIDAQTSGLNGGGEIECLTERIEYGIIFATSKSVDLKHNLLTYLLT